MVYSIRALVLMSLLTASLAACEEAEQGLDTDQGPCPLVDECPLNCPFGYAVNKDGCSVCECQSNPCSEDGSNCKFPTKHASDEKNCIETKSCAFAYTIHSCPDITCQTHCPFGFVKGRSGCPICKCKQDSCKSEKMKCGKMSACISVEEKCRDPPCGWKAKCVPECVTRTCSNSCNAGNKITKNGCKTCECKRNFCDNVKCPLNQICVQDSRTRDNYLCACDNKPCDLDCPFGLARDRNGCRVCKCVEDPCQLVTCPNDLECSQVQENVCLEEPCPYKPKCINWPKVD